MEQPMHIMGISDSPFSGTGFSEELRNIFYRLVQTGEFRISWYGLQHTGFPINVPDTIFPDLPHKGAMIKLLGTRGNPMSFGADNFLKHFLTENPEMVFFMGDPRNIVGYVDAPYFWKEKYHFPLAMYCTLDGLPIHPSWLNILNKVNVLVAMTEWAQVEFVKIGLAPAAIHHGIDWYSWKPCNTETKTKLRKKYKIPVDATIFVNWDVNQHRKRMDALLRCWSNFKPENKNAKLLLYTQWEEMGMMGFDINSLIEQYKIPRESIISPIDLQNSPKYVDCAETPEKLREIASLGDIFVSTTSGEGFGKCSLEALSLGIPVIITDYSACSEVCQKGSILIPTYEGRKGRFTYPSGIRGVESGLVDEEKFTEAMLELYYNVKERRELGMRAREWAKNFDYDGVIIPQWRNLFNLINPDEILLAELLNLKPQRG